MTLLQRYIAGEYDQVYTEILALSEEAFVAPLADEIHQVLFEMFARVVHNLQIIHDALVARGYRFTTEIKYNMDRPLHSPLPETDRMLGELDACVDPFGHVPIVLKYFYAVVGGVNFEWDRELSERPFWPEADPIQIGSLDDMLRYMSGEDWAEDMQQYVDDEEFGCAFFELSADALTKDNISGGPAYSLEIIPERGFDGRFLNEQHDTNFVGYLRICIDNCGFPGVKDASQFPGFQEFWNEVRPKMLPF
jgi:hypothetical protein